MQVHSVNSHKQEHRTAGNRFRFFIYAVRPGKVQRYKTDQSMYNYQEYLKRG